ncbi:hypothetical protein ABZ754_11950 [Micromonospora purpureochromogenes]|uniref:hypothetical protein n=1 Tax=Micromonospora purpureochromogenes TaxID=47872 RepID=UPI0033C1CEEB
MRSELTSAIDPANSKTLHEVMRADRTTFKQSGGKKGKNRPAAQDAAGDDQG